MQSTLLKNVRLNFQQPLCSHLVGTEGSQRRSEPLLLLPKENVLHIIILGTAVSHKVLNKCSSTDCKHHSTLAWATREGGVVLVEEHVVLPLSNSASSSIEAGMQCRYEKSQRQGSLLHCPSQKLIVPMWFGCSGNLATSKEKNPFWVSKCISTQNPKKVFTFLSLGHSFLQCCKSERVFCSQLCFGYF